MKIFNLADVTREGWYSSIIEAIESCDSIVIYDSDQIDINNYQITDLPTDVVGLFSSGTSGRPKLIFHDIEKLSIRKHHPPSFWGTFYRPDRMAGIQAIMHAWKTDSDLYFFNSNESWDTSSNKDKKAYRNIDFLSGTPSHFRRFDSNILLKCSKLKSITLGGEAVNSIDITNIKFARKNLKINQVYASSEFGAMCSVKDELPGLPLKFFEGSNPRFRISSEGELCVKPFAKAVNLALTKSEFRGYYATGDLVSLMGERVFFDGRKDLKVSVGGNLVSPELIEKRLNALDEVLDCRVLAKKNPILGHLLIAEIVPADSKVKSDVIIEKFDKEPIWSKPHIIKMCEAIPINVSGKINRLV